MIKKIGSIAILAPIGLFLLSGCAAQNPCAGLSGGEYYQCASYQEQVRANRVNTFNNIRQEWNNNAYQPKPKTQCYADGLGGWTCDGR